MPENRKLGVLMQIGHASSKGSLSLRRWSEFEKVKKTGVKTGGQNMILVKIESPDGKLRIGIICGRKFDKRAVVRNRARRVIRESFRLIRNGVREAHLIIIPRKIMMDRTAAEVQKELVKLLSKAGLWKEKLEF